MKLDRGLVTDLGDSGRSAREIEDAGFDGAFSFEGPHGPFFPLVLAAQQTDHLELSTAIAVAFARNPMTIAQDAMDLQRLSAGRFRLGLGSQIRPHIERRFSMPWSRPVERMEEFVRAVRAIWACWTDGVPLDFEGEFYNHTLMTPFFTPASHDDGAPPIVLAGVGDRMVEAAGRVADGLLVHPFHTVDFLAASTYPALDRGLRDSGRTRDDVEITVQTMVAIGDDEGQIAAAMSAARAQIAFYGSTPAYRGVLDLHGFGELQPRLRELTRGGRWGELAAEVPDELVGMICVAGTPSDVGRRLAARNQSASRTALVVYDQTGRDEALVELAAGVRAASDVPAR